MLRTLSLSHRARQTPPSPIRRLAHLAHAAKSRGTHVYHLNIGQPDIKTPEEFFTGVKSFNDPVLAYEPSAGNEALRQAWSRYMNRTLQLKTAPEHFLITTGASEALIFVFMSCCDPGDEIIIFDPTYANYIGFATIAGVTLRPVACMMKDNFRLPTRAAIEAMISPRTKAILLCSPNNPTGTVYSRAEQQMLLDLCNSRDIFFIVDETYREFVYDAAAPLSVLHLEPKNPRVIVIDSLSKRFSLCGARIGCLITTNAEMLAVTSNIAQARLASPTLDQFASAYMLDHISDSYVVDIRREYQTRRNTIYSALCAVPGVEVHKPEGAFYAIVKLPVRNAEEFASFMLAEFSHQGRTTFVAPAAGFYMEPGGGLEKVRIAYVLNQEAIVQAVAVLAEGLRAFAKK